MLIGIEAMHAAKEPRTGVEEYSFQIIQHLKKIIPATAQVILYTNKSPKPKAQSPNFSELFENLPPNWSVRVLAWPLGKLWSQIRLSLELLFHPPDIFFAPAQLIPFFTPKKTVATLHDSAFLVYPSAYHFWGWQYLAWMNKRILKKAALIFTSTQFNVAELKRLYPRKRLPLTVVTPLAVSKEKSTRPANCNITPHYSISKKYILSVGRLEMKKNTVALIKAFTCVRDKVDVQLVLIGSPGAGYEQVVAALAHHPYRADIILPGYVAGAALAQFICSAEVFVFPSLYEGFGLPLLEAMALGVPVVVSDIPPLHEVGGEAVSYAPKEDPDTLALAILALLQNGTRYKEQQQLGRTRAQLFSWEKTARATWESIAKLG